MHWHIPIEEMTTDDPVQTVHNFMHGMLTSWAADPNSPMAVLLRASMTSEDAAELLRHHVITEVIDPVADTIDDPDAHLRVALTGAMMMGIAAQRYLLRMPYVADADLDDILRLAGPAIQAVIVPTA